MAWHRNVDPVVGLWRGLPMDAQVKAKAWRVHPQEIPEDAEARKAWLFDWWLRIDGWIVAQRGAERVPEAVAQRLRGEDPGRWVFDPDDVGL